MYARGSYRAQFPGRAGFRGKRGKDPEEENDHMKWTMGKLLLEMPVEELPVVEMRPTITNCEYAASYNWVDSTQARILVPGRFYNLCFFH